MTPRRNLMAMLAGTAAMIAAGMPGTAAAQDGPADGTTRPAIRLDQIVIISGPGGLQTDQPASTSEIGTAAIRTLGSDKLDSVLRTVPGTFTRENPQQPGVAANIRGFEGSGRVNATVDGVRQSFRFTGHEASGFTYVDPAFLREIEVRRGAVTTAGGGGLAGTVGFRTIGVDDVILDGNNSGVLTRLQWGSNGAGPSEMIAGAFRTDRAGFVLGLSGRSSDDFRNGDGVRETSTGQDLRSALLKGEVDLGGGHRLTFGGLSYHNEFGANSYYQEVDNRTATIGYRFDPDDNDLIDLTANLYYNDTSMEYLSPIDPGSSGSAVGRKVRDRGRGFDVSNVSLGTIGDIRFRSENGVEYFRDKVTSANGGVNPADGTATSTAVFSENTFNQGSFEFVLALRYDHYKLDGAANAGGSIGAYTVDQSKGHLNPRLTLAWQATDWLQPYLTWSRSMRAPTIQETMTGGDHPGGTSASFLPNPDLRPERQRGWEIGANVVRENVFGAGDSLAVKASYFDMEVTDYIAARMNPTLMRYQYVNLDGDSHQKGFELAARYDSGRFYAELAYTHIDSEMPHQQNGLGALSDLPDDTVTLTAGTRLLDERLNLGARLHYVSNGTAITGNDMTDPGMAPITSQTSGYTLTDIFASYEFRPNAEISLKVTNLFDRAYTPALSTTGSGPGRTAYLSANFRF